MEKIENKYSKKNKKQIEPKRLWVSIPTFTSSFLNGYATNLLTFPTKKSTLEYLTVQYNNGYSLIKKKESFNSAKPEHCKK